MDPKALVHEEVTNITSTPKADLPPYSTGDQSRKLPTQADNQTQPQGGASADVTQDIQWNDHTQQGNQSAPSSGGDAIVPIPDPRYAIPLDRLLEEPAWIDCPFCHQKTQTKVDRHKSSTTDLYGCLCCLCCGILGVWMPYVFRWAQEIDHYCSGCGNRVTHKPHEGPVQVLGPPQAQEVPAKVVEVGKNVSTTDGTDQAADRTDQGQLGEKR